MTTKLGEYIRLRMEPSEPAESILKYFQRNAGKRLDKRFVGKLSAIVGESISLRQTATMTYLVWGEYPNEQQLLVSYDVKHLSVDPEFLLEHNKWAYSARKKRNEQREIFIQNEQLHHELENAVAQYRLAKSILDDTMSRVNISTHEVEEYFGL